MNARYILLIQKQFDQALSERETYELQGFLAGNEAAAKLCENMQRVLEESEKIDLPEEYKPVDAENLLTEILAAIAKTDSKSWFSFVKKFIKPKSKQIDVRTTHEDELAVLRKHKATAARTNNALNALRGKAIAEVAPVTSHDAVSLAEAIKRKMLEVQSEIQTESAAFNMQQESDAIPNTIPLRVDTTPAPAIPSISESMDQLFSSANWPVINADNVPVPRPAPFDSILKNRFNQRQQQQTEEHREHVAPGAQNQSAKQQGSTPEVDAWTAQPESNELQPIWQMNAQPQPQVPVWQLDLEAQVPIWQLEPLPPPGNSNPMDNQPHPQVSAPQQPSSQQETAPPTAPKPQPSPFTAEQLRPAGLIPVDEIIAHVSQMFSDGLDQAPPNPIPAQEDPLGFGSGAYPQINEIELRKASAARLAPANNADEPKGQIKALGKFLLDQQSETTISNLSRSNANLSHARILSDDEAIALQECLSPIESLQGVAGCIILGYDGMIITSSLPEHADKDALSAWALLTYMNSHELIRVVGHTRLRQFVSRTITGYLLLADFGQGLLLAVSDNASREAILPLMKSVRKVTAA